jgi:hypothetical protein
LNRMEESAFASSGLKSIIIPSSVEILCKSCFASCESLESVLFENDSKLQRIGEAAFYTSGLKSIIIPSSVEILCKSCFASCKSLESIIFLNQSHLIRIEPGVFRGTSTFLDVSESVLSNSRRVITMH